jgi:hypothetical protein
MASDLKPSVRETTPTVARNVIAIGLLAVFADSNRWPVVAAAVVVAAALLAVPNRTGKQPTLSGFPMVPNSRRRTAILNFVFGVGLIGGLVLVMHRHGRATRLIDAITFIAFAVPGAMVLETVRRVLVQVLRDDRTEFEAFVVVRAAAIAFAVLWAVALLYAIGDVLIELPRPSAWWVVVFGATEFTLVLRILRGRLS